MCHQINDDDIYGYVIRLIIRLDASYSVDQLLPIL